jgi:hypothetical protein
MQFRCSEEDGSIPESVDLRDTCVVISERHTALLQHSVCQTPPGVVPEATEGLARLWEA